jgi:GTPase Era involved in 16S rRNA processing
VDIKKLLEIAYSLKLQTIVDSLSFLQEREQQRDHMVFIPLVGEYSSGKTTLINALTTGKKLETAATPTTATIFEIYFSQTEEKAVVFGKDGSSEEVFDISTLKNSKLGDAKLVRVYDVSTKAPNSTVLVDTPGLSSLEERHREALTAYLPQADVIFLVTDSNQGGVTASLLKFLSIAELARKRAYLIVTKCDTRSTGELEQIREYMRKDTKLAVENIVCVAAEKGEIDELLQLIASVSEDKNKIVVEIIEQQAMAIQKNLLEQVLLLLESSGLSTYDLDAQIAKAKRAGGEMQARIRSAISELEERVDSVTLNTISGFNARIFNDLEEIIKNPPEEQDINQVAYSNINRVKSLMFANFKLDILKELRDVMRNQIEEDSMELVSLGSAVQNMSEMEYLSFNADLSLPGIRQMNKMITGGIKVAVVVAAVGLTIYFTGGTAAGEMVGTALTVDKIRGITSIMQTLNELDQRAGQFIPEIGREGEGLFGKLVSTITEHTSAKPQRQKLINEYIVYNLQPEFRRNLEQISNGLVANIETLIRESSEDAVNQIKNNLKWLKTQERETKGAYQERIAQLESYKKELQTGLRLEEATETYPL